MQVLPGMADVLDIAVVGLISVGALLVLLSWIDSPSNPERTGEGM